jgi:cysteinyl-tRNA synthetase
MSLSLSQILPIHHAHPSPLVLLGSAMSLTLYNTLTRQKSVFVPLEENKVKIYCCGVTVYDYCHLGHARSYIAWDTMRRYLEWQGYQVTYVQNFTDIDDKILKRAREEKISMDAVSEKYIAAYFEDMDRLNILRANEYPRATHTLDGIKRLIHELEVKGVAYASQGDVYYSVRSKSDYGKLSGRKFDDLEAGASGRVDEEDSRKRDPFDFALWKAAKADEPFWESPWGNGRPGWHIECSAMVRDRLGDSIDIHVGGSDLTFPHHENEIAQSEAATGQPLSNYWLHNGMVNVGGVKMSKSLGNFTTIRDLLDKGQIEPMAMRLFVLGAQYRKPIDFTEEAMTAATNGWHRLQEALRFGDIGATKLGWTLEISILPQDLVTDAIVAFNQAMDDDFNTASALAVLFDLAKGINREANQLLHQGTIDAESSVLLKTWRTLKTLASVLGLEAIAQAESTAQGLSAEAIEALIAQRSTAKAAKDFSEADRIRQELKAQGVVLVDQAGGTIWHLEGRG